MNGNEPVITHPVTGIDYFKGNSLLHLLPAAVYTCDKEGRITFFNETAERLWGYTPDINTEYIRFCACYKVWMPDGTFVTPEQTPMAIALSTGQAFRNVEAMVERPDGSTFYATVNIDPIFDNNGVLQGAINIFQDITERKEAERALKQSEQRYRELVQSLNTAIYTTDKEGFITLYNNAAAELWGREPVLGRDQWCGSYKIFKPDETEMPVDECPMARCLKEQRPVLGEEIIVMRPDGSRRYVAPHPQPMFDDAGDMIGAVNMLVDITRQKEIENALRESEYNYRDLVSSLEMKMEDNARSLKKKNEELRKSEERYHRMVDEVEDYAIILMDKDGFIQNWNKGAEKIKKYKEQEIIGKSFEIFYLQEDREIGLPKRLINEAREKGKATHEGWRVRKDGTKFWGSILITALHDDDDNVIGFTKVTRDLTERKLIEDQLKEYSNELEFQNRELKQFAYAASHDMKEPLRKIHLYNSYIAENAGATLDPRAKSYLERSLNSVKRMTGLIEDLLTYSRTTSNTDSFADVDMNELIETVIAEHKEEIEEQNVKIEAGRLPVIRAVPFQMKQLMDNLIGNSIKYQHPEREGVITISSELVKGAEINEKRANLNRLYHRISVADNGIGFEPENADKIFEVFQRLNNLPGAQGSGIGLAICKKIVQNHKGFIIATGKSNEGAGFDIYLPVTI